MKEGDKLYTGHIVNDSEARAYNAANELCERNPTEANLNNRHTLFALIASGQCRMELRKRANALCVHREAGKPFFVYCRGRGHNGNKNELFLTAERGKAIAYSPESVAYFMRHFPAEVFFKG